MLEARFVPVHQWPGKATPSHSRKRATFRAGYNATLDLLEDELTKLRAKDILVQAYFEGRDIRNDGWPRAGRRPSQPGVIVTFTKGKETVSMPCDRFDDWEDNLRAIALSLQALRAVDRYGVTSNGEQYRGFAALPAPGTSMSVQEAIAVLGQALKLEPYYVLNKIRDNPLQLESLYKMAARERHPDLGGSHEAFIQVRNAYALLSLELHGIKV